MHYLIHIIEYYEKEVLISYEPKIEFIQTHDLREMKSSLYLSCIFPLSADKIFIIFH